MGPGAVGALADEVIGFVVFFEVKDLRAGEG